MLNLLSRLGVILEKQPMITVIKSHDEAHFGNNETVLAFERNDNGVFAMDPVGRTIRIDGKFTLAHYSEKGYSGPCITGNDIQLKDGTTIKKNLFMWCYSMDEVNETAQLAVGDNEFVAVSSKKLNLLRNALNATKSDNEDKVLRMVNQMPEFDGNVSQWLSENIYYPDRARKSNHQGQVVVEFVIDEKGYVRRPKVVKSAYDDDLDKEAIRVVGSMPRWIPGKSEGKAVKVYFNLPITFKLK